MSLDTTHPDLAAEQAYVDRAYALMVAMAHDVARMSPVGEDTEELLQFEYWRETRVKALTDTKTALVFGRVDREEDDETFYIGRHHVRDEHYEPVVIDW